MYLKQVIDAINSEESNDSKYEDVQDKIVIRTYHENPEESKLLYNGPINADSISALTNYKDLVVIDISRSCAWDFRNSPLNTRPYIIRVI